MFVNCSNHNSENWGNEQREAALCYGEIADLAFPQIPVDITDGEMDELVEEYYGRIMSMEPAAVMLQGEFVFTYRLTLRLKAAGVRVVCGVTERISQEKVMPDGSVEKRSVFRFAGFREY